MSVITQDEAADRVQQIQASVDFLCATTANVLRDAVKDFNKRPPTMQSIVMFRTRILEIADTLTDGIAGGLVQVRGSGESRRVEPR